MSQQRFYDALSRIGDLPAWKSIVINRRKPHTDRAFTVWGETRIYLHCFELCEPEDSCPHPHPWPSSMWSSTARTKCSLVTLPAWIRAPANVIRLWLGPGSIYEMSERQTWRPVIPRTRCFSRVINEPYWEEPHSRAP